MAAKNDQKPNEYERFQDYLKTGEEAAMYLYGVADAYESLGGEHSKRLIHHLRIHADELKGGRLWVEHNYRERKAEDGK